VRTFAGHRATQLVAVLVLGLAIGAGVTALAVDGRDGGDHREHRWSDRGPDDRGPGDRGDRDWDDDGPGR
jgi:hypothetical protein